MFHLLPALIVLAQVATATPEPTAAPVPKLGGGFGQKPVAVQKDEDELDDTIADGVSLAGERFKRILDQMMKAR